MTDHSNIAQLISRARRQLGLTQSELARQVGCRQSAVSMFERGHLTALARPTIKAILVALKLDAALADAPPNAPLPDNATESTTLLAYCPVFDCPSNIPFTVQGTLMLKPSTSPSATARHCAYCGELLERMCPECGIPINDGACCNQCGTPYICPPPELGGPETTLAWADRQRGRLRELGIIRVPVASPFS